MLVIDSRRVNIYRLYSVRILTSGLIALNTTVLLSALSHPYLKTVFYTLANALNNTLKPDRVVDTVDV